MCEQYPNFGCYNTELNCKEWWKEVSVNTLRCSNCAEDIGNETLGAISDTLYDYFTLPECWFVYKDIDALPSIKEAGFMIGAISNFDERLGSHPLLLLSLTFFLVTENILENLKIKEYFDFIIPSYNVGCHKPDHQYVTIEMYSHIARV